MHVFLWKLMMRMYAIAEITATGWKHSWCSIARLALQFVELSGWKLNAEAQRLSVFP
jgi:hypothetical protein